MDQSTASSRLLDLLLPQWHQQIQSWAQDGSIRRAAQEALLLEGEPARLAELVNQWAQGDFSALPPIVLLEGSAIPGAAGAYAISPGTIYLNQDWLQTAGDERVLAVLTEELGHHLDGLLNPSDTPGDEGELFAALLNGSGPSSEEHRPAVLAENDHATVRVAGAPVAAEQAAIVLRTPVPQAAPGRTRHEWQNSMAFAALRSDGSVVTWGHHTNGGDSSGVDFDGPANNLRVTRIIPNSRGTFAARRSDGSVVAWGESLSDDADLSDPWWQLYLWDGSLYRSGNSSGVDFDGPDNNLRVVAFADPFTDERLIFLHSYQQLLLQRSPVSPLRPASSKAQW